MPLVQQTAPVTLLLPTSKELPTEQQETVTMDASPLRGGDMINIDDITNAIQLNIEVLSGRISAWTVKDTDGQVAEVSKDTIARLPFEDLAFLVTQLNMGAGNAGLPKAPEKTLSDIL